ncbi:MAG: hypothetical protein V4671_33215, partial [Armatimonadota bacterium]
LGAFGETGGAAALGGTARTAEEGTFTLGVEAATQSFDFAGGILTVRITTAVLAVGSLLLPFAVSLPAASAQEQVQAEKQAKTDKPDVTPRKGDLETDALPGGYLPVRQQLSRLSTFSGYRYTADKEMPNARLFIAVGPLDNTDAANRQEVRNQIAELLTGPKWQYLWTAQTAPEKEAKEPKAFVLGRHAITEAERQAKLTKAYKEKLRYLADLVEDWPAQQETLKKENIDLANDFNAAFVRGGISLLDSLPPDVVNQALSGQTTDIAAATLSDEQLGFLEKYNSQYSSASKADLQANYAIRLLPKGNEGGLIVGLYTKDKADFHGYDVLDLTPIDEFAEERQKIGNVGLAKVVKKDRVTIRWDIPAASPDEPPLAAYLRSFAEQTGLTVLGRFPDPKAQAPDKAGKAAARLYNRRMSKSIVNKPLAEALNTLCSVYQSYWILDKPINPEAGVTVASDVPQSAASKKDSDLPNKKRGHIIRFWAYVVTPATR